MDKILRKLESKIKALNPKIGGVNIYTTPKSEGLHCVIAEQPIKGTPIAEFSILENWSIALSNGKTILFQVEVMLSNSYVSLEDSLLYNASGDTGWLGSVRDLVQFNLYDLKEPK